MLPAKFWFIWPSGFRGDFFRTRPIRNKNCLWQPCLLTDLDEMSNLYRGPSVDASYQVSVHLAKWFQRRLFRYWPIRNKNCLWQPCLLTYRDEISIFYRGPTKFRFIWQSGVGRRRFLKNRPIRNKNCLWWPCLLMNRDEMSNVYRGPSI